MSAKLLCVGAIILGGVLGSCLPASSEDRQPAGSSQASSAPVADVPLEIVISQFPGGYQGKWAATAAECFKDPENSDQVISLQGRLVKLHDSIGTMTAGKRLTSRTMQAEFEFVGDSAKWNTLIAFEMSEDMKRLRLSGGKDGTSNQYVQCPKLMAG